MDNKTRKELLEEISELNKKVEQTNLDKDFMEHQQMQKINLYQREIDRLREEISFLKRIIEKFIKED